MGVDVAGVGRAPFFRLTKVDLLLVGVILPFVAGLAQLAVAGNGAVAGLSRLPSFGHVDLGAMAATADA